MKRIILILILILNFQNCFSKVITDYFYTLTSDLKYGNFINDKELFIVGSDGYVIYSSDKGNTWKRKLTYTFETLNQFTFQKESQTLFIVGSNGIFLKSTDKGDSFEIIKLGVNSNLNSISFENNFGIIVGDSGKVFLSNDYGNTWTQENYLTKNNIYKCIIYKNRLFFSDNKNIIYVKSINDTEWTILNKNEEITKKSAPVKILGYEDNLYILGNDFLLRLNITLTKWSNLQLTPSNILRDMEITDSNEITVYSMNIVNNNQFFKETFLDLTNFNIKANDILPDFEIKMYLSSATVLNDVFVSPDFSIIFAIGNQNTIAKKYSNKKEWEILSQQNSSGAGFTIPYFFNDSVGILAKEMQLIEKTYDFGCTFLPEDNQLQYESKSRIHNIIVENDKRAYLLTSATYGFAKLYRTEDQFSTFTGLPIKIPNASIYNFDIKDNIMLITCSDKSSSDEKFTIINCYNLNNNSVTNTIRFDSCWITSCKILNDSLIIMSGNKYNKPYYWEKLKSWVLLPEGRIYKSTNLGKNWEEITINKLSQISNIYYVNDKIAFLFGSFMDTDSTSYQCMWRTTNQGLNWEVQFDSSRYNYKNIIIDKETGYGLIIRLDGAMWETKDYGENWKPITDSIPNFNQEYFSNFCFTGKDYIVVTNKRAFKSYSSKLKPNSVEEHNNKLEDAPPFWVYVPYPNPSQSNEINLKIVWSKQIDYNEITYKLLDFFGNEVSKISRLNYNFNELNRASVNISIERKISGFYYLQVKYKNTCSTFPVIFY